MCLIGKEQRYGARTPGFSRRGIRAGVINRKRYCYFSQETEEVGDCKEGCLDWLPDLSKGRISAGTISLPPRHCSSGGLSPSSQFVRVQQDLALKV